MRAWITEIAEPLPTSQGVRLMRCGILADELARQGWDVTWWTSCFDHLSKTYRAEPDEQRRLGDRYRIVFLGGSPYRANVSLARLRHQREVSRAFARRAPGESRPDVIFCALPTLEVTEAAVRYAQAARVPVMVDVRDLWPDAFVRLVPGPLRPVMRMLVSSEQRRATFALRHASGITAVSDEYLKWGLRLAGRAATERDGVFPLGYPEVAVSAEQRREAIATLERAGVDGRKLVCCFIGTFGIHYDLSPVIEAARSASQRGNRELQFVFAGDGERRRRWEREAAGLDNIIFAGWISSPTITLLLERSSIALAAYEPGVTQGLPNKIFEYLSAGLPVLSSLRGEAERLLARGGCGLTYEAGNAGSFAAALDQVLDADVRRRMGHRGRQLFIAEFSAARVYGRLATHLASVAS